MAYPTSPTNGQIYKDTKYNNGRWIRFSQPEVGTIYVQHPGKSDPTTLYGGSWTDVSSAYAGGFFRAAGGNASTFGGGVQAGQNLSHGHGASSGTVSSDHSHGFSTGGDECQCRAFSYLLG